MKNKTKAFISFSIVSFLFGVVLTQSSFGASYCCDFFKNNEKVQACVNEKYFDGQPPHFIGVCKYGFEHKTRRIWEARSKAGGDRETGN